MTESIGLPKLKIAFQAAAQAVSSRSKKGYVGVIVRDAKAQGLHKLLSDTMIPGELGEENRAYLQDAFTGSDRGRPSLVYALVIAPSTEEGVNTASLTQGLGLLEPVSLDYLAAMPDAVEEELALVDAWVRKQREEYRTVKLVRPAGEEGSNSMGVIDFDEPGLKVGNKPVPPARFCARIAGVLAGTPMGMSATYAPLPEVTAVTGRDKDAQAAAVDNGRLILLHDGQKAKIARGVNSLTEIPAEGKADWRKIKVVETMDLITYYLRTTVDDEYRGRYPNTYDNKQVLVSEISAWFQELEAQGVLNQGESCCEIDYQRQFDYLRGKGVDVSGMTEQQILEYQTDSWVFLRCGGRVVDAMEDFEVLFNNH